MPYPEAPPRARQRAPRRRYVGLSMLAIVTLVVTHAASGSWWLAGVAAGALLLLADTLISMQLPLDAPRKPN